MSRRERVTQNFDAVEIGLAAFFSFIVTISPLTQPDLNPLIFMKLLPAWSIAVINRV